MREREGFELGSLQSNG